MDKIAMQETKNSLLTQKYTKVLEEVNYDHNAPHYFSVIRTKDNEELCNIQFQNGPIKEAGVNGVMDEDLIAMVIRRLEGFQGNKFACKENEKALEKLQESLMWLRKRTMDREARNVEGTHIV